jgi:hypothetical protein
VFLYESRNMLTQNIAARPPEDVANKKYAQMLSPPCLHDSQCYHSDPPLRDEAGVTPNEWARAPALPEGKAAFH